MMPLPQQSFDFARGQSLEGLFAIFFTVDADVYPNGTVIPFTFRIWSTDKATALLAITGSDTVADLQFQIELTAVQTASLAVGVYNFEAWDTTNSVPFAQGRVTVTKSRTGS